MGMFDYLRSSYNLGEQFTNKELQTKDVEEYGIGGTMSHFSNWHNRHSEWSVIPYNTLIHTET